MKKILFPFGSLLCLALIFWACANPLDHSASSPGVTAAGDIKAGAAAGASGDPAFSFLPPLVKDGTFDGTFDPSLSPVVRIDELGGEPGGVFPLEFSMGTGGGSERVRVVPDEEHYIVNWHTGKYPVKAELYYRITVFVDGEELGHIDVDPVDKGSGLKDVDSALYAGLKIGRTLPVKFRIEEAGEEPPPPPEFTVTEIVAASSGNQESNPRLGRDETGPILVYTSQTLMPDGSYMGDIYYQRLNDDGTLSGPPVLVSPEETDDKFGDISGSLIVYTAFESPISTLGELQIYDVSSGATTPVIAGPDLVREVRIDGNAVVWSQGQNGVTKAVYRDLAWDPGETLVLVGPAPSATSVEIDSRFVVWEQSVSAQKNIAAFDRLVEAWITVSADPGFDERYPSTSGTWVAWQAEGPAGEMQIRLANLAKKPVAVLTAVDDGTHVSRPGIDGDLVAYESDAAGDWDIYLYRISDGRTFRVTDAPGDQYLCSLRGNMVAYMDLRGSTLDIYLSVFTLPPVE